MINSNENSQNNEIKIFDMKNDEIEQLKEQISKLKGKLQDTIRENVKLKQEVYELKKQQDDEIPKLKNLIKTLKFLNKNQK